MEFWSGILGAVVGGAIALIGTVFSSIYTYRCQIKSEQRQEKKRIYIDICGILGGMETVMITVDQNGNQTTSAQFDIANFHVALEQLNAYMTDHSGELSLYLPNEIYSALMRIKADMYQAANHDYARFDCISTQGFTSEYELIKSVVKKVWKVQALIKNDLYPTNRKNMKRRKL